MDQEENNQNEQIENNNQPQATDKIKNMAQDEIKKQGKNMVKEALKAITNVIASIATAITAMIGPIAIIIIILVMIVISIFTFFVTSVNDEGMVQESAAEFWFPIAKDDIMEQYFNDGNRENGLKRYENSSTDKTRTIITSPMGPRNRSAGNNTITWDEFNKLSSSEQEHFHRAGRTVMQDQHKGIDIGAGKLVKGNSTEIIASQSGEVTLAVMDNGNGYGNYIEITSDDNYPQRSMTRYAHLSELSVKKGDHVTQGQVIGIIGGSGGYAVHLHFEIWQEGDVVDPRTKLDWEDPWRVGGTISSSTNDAIIEYIHAWEGTPPESGGKYVVFDDGAGYATVGWGVTITNLRSYMKANSINTVSESDMRIGGRIDKNIVDAAERAELDSARQSINSQLDKAGIKLKQYQLDALLSRVFNCGPGKIPTFIAAYKKYGETQALYNNHMNKPDTANGKVMKGLVKRRESEWELFTTGIGKREGKILYDYNTMSQTNNSSTNTPTNTQVSGSVQTKINNMLKEAARIANDDSYTYVYGATGPKSYDCSAFTQYLYKKYLGITLPRSSGDQSSYMSKYKIPVNSAQPGDLLWHSGHVALYYGQGQSVEAIGSKWGIGFMKFPGNNRWTHAYSLSKYFAK